MQLVSMPPLVRLGRPPRSIFRPQGAHKDARAVDQQLATVRHRPIETDHLEKTCHPAAGPTQGQFEHSLRNQTGLNRGMRADSLTPRPAGRRGRSLHPGIEPGRKQTSLHQRCIEGLPVRRAVACAGRHADRRPITDQIHKPDPRVIFVTKRAVAAPSKPSRMQKRPPS